MIGKYTSGEDSAIMERVLNAKYESTLMVTAQDTCGITVDAVEIPVVQFIGGGVDRSFSLWEERYRYDVEYVDEKSVRITKSDNIDQIRLWIR